MDLTFHPLTPGRWRDLETIFASRGCSMARACWCMFYRESGAPAVAPGQSLSAARKQRLQRLAAAPLPPGLLAYRDATPVGWLSLGPREHFRKLVRSPVMRPVDATPVWSLICFVVPPAHRHQGVASALLREGIRFARSHGATVLEAYPVDKAIRGKDDWLWFGAKSMYDAAGFVEVARRKPERPVVRLHLDQAEAPVDRAPVPRDHAGRR